MSNTEFINLSEIYLPTAGGSIDGDVEVGGALQVNDGSGAGTNYDVAAEIAELKSAWDSVSPKQKKLWEGTWDVGETITVANITKYNSLIFVTDEWVCIPVSFLPNNSAYLKASILYPATSNNSLYAYCINCQSDELGSENWTMNDKNLVTLSGTSISINTSPSFTIMRIYGVI